MAAFSSLAFSTSAFSTAAFDFGSVTPVDPGWLGGGAKDIYHARKRQIEELDRIDKAIAEGKKAAIRALTEIEIPKEIEAPKIRAIDKELLADLRKIRLQEFNIQALLGEISLIRQYLLAQQEAAFALQMDDEAAFLLMLN